jgi:iron complex transport system ATP-binding protein
MCVSQALEKVELTSQKYQLFNTLSGGEKQRVRMAKAFCQQAQILILDEPTNHLDLKHQVTLKKLLSTYEGTVILTLHDLNFASQLCDRLLLLKGGKLLMEGKTLDVLNSDKLTSAYETKFERQLQNGLLTINPIYD